MEQEIREMRKNERSGNNDSHDFLEKGGILSILAPFLPVKKRDKSDKRRMPQ
jgi:hypothetical protein